MNDSSNRKLETCRRVEDFCTARAADFSATSLATQLFATLATGIDTLEGLAAAQTSGGGAAREGTATRGDAREELRSQMKAWSATAHAIAIDNPGLEHKFRVPRGENDEVLIAAARAFATDAVPLSAQFIAHEMPATFIDDMNASIVKFSNTMSKQSSAVGDRVGARAAFEAELDECLTVVRQLDPIMRNKYADDPATLAEWTSASHVERAPKKKKTPQPQSN
ncbi:MAG TPA: hypothetical protein VNG71_04220 [Pyrinomonadaceae bacterium]|nr:hypothetical protein [Pyrinomonadaceae bacterium]